MSNNKIAKRALKPPMGWNSWDCFGTNVTESEVRANAEFMAENLKQVGWEYVVVDLGWYAPGVDNHNYKTPNIPMLLDDFGRLIPDPERFPSSANGKGFKPLADFVHSLGLKFGIHIMRGIPWNAVDLELPVKGTSKTANQISYNREQCPWFRSMHTLDFGMTEAQAYYDSIFKLYAEWGVDYIKADDVNAWHETNKSSGSPTGEGSPYRIDDIEGMAKAINNSGRDMVFSISPGGPETTVINHLRNNANLWRISADFWDEWGSLKTQMDRCSTWAPFVKEGHWPDADMLPLGDLPRGESGGINRKTNFTKEEQRTVMTLWSICRSPLMFGGNLPKSDMFTIDLITNDEVLFINQNSNNNRLLIDKNETKIWAADDMDGNTYVAFFNTSDQQKTVKITFEELGIAPTHKIRDVWKKENLGKVVNEVSHKVPAHGAYLFLLS